MLENVTYDIIDRFHKDVQNRRQTDGLPPEMVDNNLVLRVFLFLNGLLAVLDDKALITAVDTLTSKVVNLAITCLFGLHHRDAKSFLTHQDDVINIVPATL